MRITWTALVSTPSPLNCMIGLEHRGCRSDYRGTHFGKKRHDHYLVFCEANSGIPKEFFEIQMDDMNDPIQRGAIGVAKIEPCGRSARKILNKITPDLLDQVRNGTLKLKATALLKGS